MNILSNIRHIIWDWNGTLLNDRWLCLKSINHLLHKRGLPLLDDQKYLQIFRFPVKDYYELAGFDFTKEDFATPAMEFINLYNDGKFSCSMHDGAFDVLDKLYAKGIKQYLLSASEKIVLSEMVKHYNIGHYFTHLEGLDNHYAAGKLGLGRELLSKIKAEKSKIVMIGDTCHDGEVAADLGIEFISYSNGHYLPERLSSCSSLQIDKLSELLSLVNTQEA
ncbi:MAG: HAD family hydrolase [Bacteroidetes bacterium]|jgi:phosphoglycolate phosphatase|nr:HAD family hydrolase [Bacteroidota bacterium]MBT4401597.1 HAD family hydrolase [Bacteroidota bacterium]MBT4410333.1 HAD family hydrolase [Bacteroidota bacterium]MBT5425711.1 HAD family hydrolase [Bacteroidota bacterium]MBT7464825.1 HAD family hydrolase [Bacteroidota bacterium]